MKKNPKYNPKVYLFCAICYKNLLDNISASSILKNGITFFPNNTEILVF